MSANPAEAPQQLPEQPSALERLAELNALLNGQTGTSVEDYGVDPSVLPQSHAQREQLVRDYFTRQMPEGTAPAEVRQGSNGARVFGQGGGASHEAEPYVIPAPEAPAEQPSNIAKILAPENHVDNVVSASAEQTPASKNAAQQEFSPEDVQFFESLSAMSAQEQAKALRERASNEGAPGNPASVAIAYHRYLKSLPNTAASPDHTQGSEQPYAPSRPELASTKGQVREFKRIMGLSDDERADALDQLNQTERDWYGDYSRNHQPRSPENQRRRRLKIGAAAGAVVMGTVVVAGTYMAMKHGHDSSLIHHMVGNLKPTKGTLTVPTPKIVADPNLLHGIASAAQAASSAAAHAGASAGASAGHAAGSVANHAPTVHLSPAEITQAHTTAFSLSEHLPHGFEQMQGYAKSAMEAGDLKQVPHNGSYYWELTAKGAAKIGAHGNKSNLDNVMKLLSTYSNGQMSVG